MVWYIKDNCKLYLWLQSLDFYYQTIERNRVLGLIWWVFRIFLLIIEYGMKKFTKCWDFGKSMFYVWLKLVLFCWILNQFGYKNNWTTKMFDFSIGRFQNIQRWQLVILPWCMNFLNEMLVVFFWFAFVYRWSMKVVSSKCWF